MMNNVSWTPGHAYVSDMDTVVSYGKLQKARHLDTYGYKYNVAEKNKMIFFKLNYTKKIPPECIL